MEIVRNLTRRKLRTTLTISGIVIGVLALVTMGAMAEKFNGPESCMSRGCSFERVMHVRRGAVLYT